MLVGYYFPPGTSAKDEEDLGPHREPLDRGPTCWLQQTEQRLTEEDRRTCIPTVSRSSRTFNQLEDRADQSNPTGRWKVQDRLPGQPDRWPLMFVKTPAVFCPTARSQGKG